MKVRYASLWGVLLLVVASPTRATSPAWNFANHRAIARRAVHLLPEGSEVRTFYERSIASLDRYVVEPDKNKETDPSERPHHYFHMNHYDLAKLREEKFPRPSVASTDGDLPWRLQEVFERLVDAVKAGDDTAIFKWTGYVAHYVGDAHMPLHATSRYDCTLKETLHHKHDKGKNLHARIDDYEAGDADYWCQLAELKYEYQSVTAPLEVVFAVLVESRSLADEIWESDLAGDSSHRVDAFPNLADKIAARIARSSLVVASFLRTAWERAKGVSSTDPHPRTSDPKAIPPETTTTTNSATPVRSGEPRVGSRESKPMQPSGGDGDPESQWIGSRRFILVLLAGMALIIVGMVVARRRSARRT